jgi:SAM-dependent methyltransferase
MADKDEIPGQNDFENIIKFNERAWDISVEEQNCWTIPVNQEELDLARKGNPRIVLTPTTPVPQDWLGSLNGKKVLALAGGGGQQGPLLAAAGALVTVFDISSKQLEVDKKVSTKENLNIRTVQGDAADLSFFSDCEFDLIVNPVSNCFFPDLMSVWKECSRVLKFNGDLLVGFTNPIVYCFDFEKANRGEFQMKYKQPYSDLESLDENEKKRFLRKQTPLEYGHSLTSQMGGLIKEGFSITGFFEDKWHTNEPINKFLPQFISIKAKKTAAS